MNLPFENIKREILVKRKADTSDKFGCDPNKRSVEELINYGVVNIDKPRGPTSHQVSAYVQKILNLKKAGHSGTLDPHVTGVLMVALGRATRIVESLLKAGKEYVGIMHLHKDVSEEELRKIINEFIGKIKQLPPIKSSVKRQLRQRTVYYFEILEIDGKDVLFRTGVEAGTYIRKLCHDMGQKLGGAHMAELRRTKVGCFGEDKLVSLQDLTDAFEYYKEGNDKYIRYCIQPIENAVKHLPKIWILDTTVSSLTHGIDLKIPGISKLDSGISEGDEIAVMTLKNELVAIGTSVLSSEQIIKKEKGVAVKIHKVFMKQDVYPRV